MSSINKLYNKISIGNTRRRTPPTRHLYEFDIVTVILSETHVVIKIQFNDAEFDLCCLFLVHTPRYDYVTNTRRRVVLERDS